ncbi:MAG: ABC transporter ATP-binding protein [Lachnospiraceae bacterium]|nr:ABC transporter ATP-binding protein [Lachnospiraceae bacterium]
MKFRKDGTLRMKLNKKKLIIHELRLMMRESKAVTVISVLSLMLGAFLSVANMVTLNSLYEAIEAMKGISDVIKPFLIAGIIIVLYDVINAVFNYYTGKQHFYNEKVYMRGLFGIADKMSPEDNLDPVMLQRIEQVASMKEEAGGLLIQLEILLASELLYSIGVLIFAFMLHPLLAVVILAVAMPPLFSYGLKKKFRFSQAKETANIRRRKKSFFEYVTDLAYCKETRFWHMEDFFIKKYKKETDEERKVALKVFHKNNLVDFICNIMYVCGYAVLIVVIYYLVSKKEISVAQVVTMLTIIVSIYDKINELMGNHIANLGTSVAAFDAFYEFYDSVTEEIGAEKLDDKPIGIKFDKVSFKYPSAESYALHNVSFEINQGEVVAIVGENGAGKSTLSKIMAGLYKPENGKLYYNGVDREKLNMKSLYKAIAYVFQDYCRYPLTVRENIGLSDTNNDEKIDAVLDKVGMKEVVSGLSEGKDTLVAKEFGGTDLSGGQWQRIAIARAAYKNGNLIIFDEPTAAIDPYEEVRIIEMLLNVSKGKTVVIVTHRIGAARLADKIIAVKDGTVVETGKHDELIKQNGEYARLYNTQASWYTV